MPTSSYFLTCSVSRCLKMDVPHVLTTLQHPDLLAALDHLRRRRTRRSAQGWPMVAGRRTVVSLQTRYVELQQPTATSSRLYSSSQMSSLASTTSAVVERGGGLWAGRWSTLTNALVFLLRNGTWSCRSQLRPEADFSTAFRPPCRAGAPPPS